VSELTIGMASKFHFLICSPNAAQNQQQGNKLKKYGTYKLSSEAPVYFTV